MQQVETEIVQKIVQNMTTVRSRIVELERNFVDQVMDIRADVGNLETWQDKVDRKLKNNS